MRQTTIPASFVRGGTSKALIFQRSDLPASEEDWTPILLAAMGSPDPHGRQLNGMGGGLSSLSKIAVVGPSSHPEADVDYTFVQVMVDRPAISMDGNCGNISSAIGPWAVDEGLVPALDGMTSVMIHNTNTGKLIRSTFPVIDGCAAVNGDFAIDGVEGTGACVTLDFLDPGGSRTGRLFPTGKVCETLPGAVGPVDATLIDAGNPFVLIDAQTTGLTGEEPVTWLADAQDVLQLLEELRRTTALRMGLARDIETASASPVPLIGLVGPSRQVAGHLAGRMLSMGAPHRALPGTASVALSICGRIPGTVVTRYVDPDTPLTIRHPGGLMLSDARVRSGTDGWHAISVELKRTQRTLFRGEVLLPCSSLSACAQWDALFCRETWDCE